MSVKDQILASFVSLPDDASWADAAERLRLLTALDAAEREIANGQEVSHESAKARIAACLQKLSGRQVA